MKFIHLMCSLLALVSVSLVHPLEGSPPSHENQLHWVTNYDKAVELSKSTQRPIFLFFTGSDWCGWCNKLESEVLDTKEFFNTMGDKLIFVKVDFPTKKKLDPATTAQNEKLQKRFTIRSYPTIVLLDSDQQPIGMTGYRAGGAKQYSAHLMKMVNEYAVYKQEMRRLSYNKSSGKELKRLYQKSQEMGLKSDQNLIVRMGIDSDLSPFFLAERYRFLVAEGQNRSEEAAAIKQRLLTSDPENKTLAHYQIAIIDYEACAELMQKEKMNLDDSVKPLLNYIKGYGAQDSENLWKLNMILTQLYLDQNRLDDALKYAKDSLASAPASIQSNIGQTISNIQKQIDIESKAK